MAALVQQRCLNHLDREAVARCPECANFFCRECVIEHDDRLLCAACLRALNAAAPIAGIRLAALMPLARAAFGMVAGWLFFYLIGRALLAIPASYHDGTFWHSP